MRYAVMLFLLACGDDDGAIGDAGARRDTGPPGTIDAGPARDAAGTDAGPPSGADAGPIPSGGCGTAAESGERTIATPDGMRTYLVQLPTGYDPDTPAPLVFGFHGATTSGRLFASAGYGNLGSTLGDWAILVYPDALGMPTQWEAKRDVPFIDLVLDALEAELCVDEARVFATGHSSGGFFSNAVGCERGERFRAIAPVSGGGPFVFGGRTCEGEVAAWIAHGSMDDIVDPMLGRDSRDFWAEANGCDLASSSATPPDPCVAYTCENTEHPVVWCEYGGAHEWPRFAPQGISTFFRRF
jgi:poly(3-hydroxybutyrate) depolymerase